MDFDRLSRCGGVYRLTNIANGRFYIGSAGSFRARWGGHLSALAAGTHANRFLQADYAKTGSGAFLFSIVCVVDGNLDDRLAVEDEYVRAAFDGGKRCYNLTPNAIARRGKSRAPRVFPPLGPCSDETKRKISAANSGAGNGMFGRVGPRLGAKLTTEQRRAIGDAQRGKKRGPHSEETRRKIGDAQRGRPTGRAPWNKGKPWSEEARSKMSASHQRRLASK